MGNIEELQEDLADLSNVDDVEEDVSTTGELFSISSFGVDYPVETLISRMEKKLFTFLRFNALLSGLKTNVPVL